MENIGALSKPHTQRVSTVSLSDPTLTTKEEKWLYFATKVVFLSVAFSSLRTKLNVSELNVAKIM